ncbi:MAG: putative intracellular protease/amidase [Candidatus Azotimanducaceae bacterium]
MVGAVCHGPAALVIVMLDSGEALLVNKQVSGFTNEEGLFLIPSVRETFPFLLEDGLAS